MFNGKNRRDLHAECHCSIPQQNKKKNENTANSYRLDARRCIMSSWPRFSGYVSLLLVFFLGALPLDAFSLFLAFYFCQNLWRQLFWSSAVRRRDASVIPYPSNLFWSSVLLLCLPYILFGAASLLQFSSSSIIRMGQGIPYRNALAAIILEGILLGCQWVNGLYVWS